MKAKTLIPLIVVLAVLVGIVVYQRSVEEEPTLVEQAAFEAIVPEGLEAGEVTKIELYSGGIAEEKVVLEEAEDGQWRVASHFNAPASEEAVTEYLETLTDVRGEFRAEADSEEELQAYNLTEEQGFHVLAYTGEGEPAVHLLVGKAPDFNTVFLREAGGGRVYTESANLRRDAGVVADDAETAPTADKWIDKNVLEVAQENVTRIALSTPDKELVFEKVAQEAAPAEAAPEAEADAETPAAPAPVEYEWKLVSGGVAPEHKQPGLDKILTRLAALTANTVVDPAKKEEFGLAEPAFTATISVEGQEEDVVLKAGRPDPAGSGYLFKADNPDVVYEVSQVNFEQIFPKGSELFDLAGMTVNQEEISRIEIAQPEGNVILAKQGDTWQVEAPQSDLEVQRTKIDGVANALSTWKPVDYVDADKAPSAFDTTITITAGGATHTLRIDGPARGVDGSYVKLEGSDQAMVMGAADVGRIAVSPRDLYQLKALNVMQSAVNQVQAQIGGESLTMLKAGEDWTVMSGGETGSCGAGACADFLSTLVNFQATDIDFDAQDAAWGDPYAQVTLTQDDGQTHTLNFSPAENGSHRLKVSGKNTLLTVSEEDFAPIASDFAAVRENIEEAAAPAETAPAEQAPAEPAPEAPAPVVMEGAPADQGLPPLSVSPASPEPAPMPEPAPTPEPAPSSEPAPEAAPAPVDVTVDEGTAPAEEAMPANTNTPTPAETPETPAATPPEAQSPADGQEEDGDGSDSVAPPTVTPPAAETGEESQAAPGATATTEPMSVPEPEDAPARELAPANESAIQAPMELEEEAPAPEVMAPEGESDAPASSEEQPPAEAAPAPAPEPVPVPEVNPESAAEDDALIETGAAEEAAPEEEAPAEEQPEQ